MEDADNGFDNIMALLEFEANDATIEPESEGSNTTDSTESDSEVSELSESLGSEDWANVESNEEEFVDSNEYNHRMKDNISSTDSSEYHDIPTPQKPQGEEYFWDEETESPTFQSVLSNEANSTVVNYHQNLPHHWPPRRLSSEYNCQMEVTLLPGAGAHRDQYFDEDAFTDSPDHNTSDQVTEDLLGEDTQRLNSACPPASTSDNINDEASNQLSVDHRPDTHLDQATKSSSVKSLDKLRKPLQLQTSAPKRSKRLEHKPRLDYDILHSRGRSGTM